MKYKDLPYVLGAILGIPDERIEKLYFSRENDFFIQMAHQLDKECPMEEAESLLGTALTYYGLPNDDPRKIKLRSIIEEARRREEEKNKLN